MSFVFLVASLFALFFCGCCALLLDIRLLVVVVLVLYLVAMSWLEFASAIILYVASSIAIVLFVVPVHWNSLWPV